MLEEEIKNAIASLEHAVEGNAFVGVPRSYFELPIDRVNTVRFIYQSYGVTAPTPEEALKELHDILMNKIALAAKGGVVNPCLIWRMTKKITIDKHESYQAYARVCIKPGEREHEPT